MYTLTTAADATGKNRSTILRSIKAGKISATRNSDGHYQIDPAELHRVYAPVAQQPETQQTPQEAPDTNTNATGKALALRVAAKQLQAQVQAHQATIDDLRARLDASEAERRQVTSQLAGLLTHQQSTPPAQQHSAPTFWRRFFGGPAQAVK